MHVNAVCLQLVLCTGFISILTLNHVFCMLDKLHQGCTIECISDIFLSDRAC